MRAAVEPAGRGETKLAAQAVLSAAKACAGKVARSAAKAAAKKQDSWWCQVTNADHPRNENGPLDLRDLGTNLAVPHR